DLTIWDLGNQLGPKALRRGSTGGAQSAELTAAGELLALPVASSIAFIDTNDGKLVGCVEREEPAKRLAFSPDGKILAAYQPFSISLYGMNDGQEIRTVAVSESNPGASLRWVGEHLLV